MSSSCQRLEVHLATILVFQVTLAALTGWITSCSVSTDERLGKRIWEQKPPNSSPTHYKHALEPGTSAFKKKKSDGTSL